MITPTIAIVGVITLAVSGFLVDRFSAIKILPFYLLPTMGAYFLVITSSWAFTPIVMMTLIAMTNGTSSVLLTSTWSEIYGTKYLGGIRSVTISFFVFSTAVEKTKKEMVTDLIPPKYLVP